MVGICISLWILLQLNNIPWGMHVATRTGVDLNGRLAMHAEILLGKYKNIS